MPVGTQATVKGLTPDQLLATGTRMLLANTYHLALRPGEESVAALGGLHAFMGWDGPILTDSGGFQVFSLADRSRITDQGVTFRSHIDGRLLELTPERAVAIQEASGPTWPCAWTTARRCRPAEDEIGRGRRPDDRAGPRAARRRTRAADQALFGIVQGGTHADLRARVRRGA